MIDIITFTTNHKTTPRLLHQCCNSGGLGISESSEALLDLLHQRIVVSLDLGIGGLRILIIVTEKEIDMNIPYRKHIERNIKIHHREIDILI